MDNLNNLFKNIYSFVHRDNVINESDYYYNIFCNNPIFTGISRNELIKIYQYVTVVEKAENEFLFHEGDPSDTVYIIIEGIMEVLAFDKQRQVQHKLETLHVGQVIGEITLVNHMPRTASILSKTASKLFVIPFKFIEKLDEKNWLLISIFCRNSLSAIVMLLKKTEFFSNVDVKSLKEFAKKFEFIKIKAGEILIKQDDEADYLYFVIKGHLRAIKDIKTLNSITLGEIYRGELIGELAILTQEKRVCSVIVIRDSLLLKISKSHFDEFFRQNTNLLMPIVKSSILRVMNKTKPTAIQSVNIALLPAGKQSPLFKAFSESYLTELSKHATILNLNSKDIQPMLNQAGIAYEPNFNSTRLVEWINDQESIYSYIIYQADEGLTEWTKLCLRQVDRIILVATSGQDEALNPIEEKIHVSNIFTQKLIELVIVHEGRILQPKNTSLWLTPRKIKMHHHVKLDTPPSISKLVRYTIGKTNALVCGGGGARAFAYIGAYKAFQEFNIPIDMIGGTSAGALVSVMFCYDYSIEEIIHLFKQGIAGKNRRSLDYTLPFVSIFAGKIWSKELIKAHGDVNIEDLWRNFFCIGTNLTRHKIEVLQKGLVWKAIRATVALPGIVPPISNSNNELLIDGSILNNLPVDIMQTLMNNGKIMTMRLSADTSIKGDIHDGYVSGWGQLMQRVNPFNKHTTNLPSMMEIIINSNLVGSQEHELNVMSLADFHINLDMSYFKLLDFKPIDEIVALGYQQTLNILSEIDTEHLTTLI